MHSCVVESAHRSAMHVSTVTVCAKNKHLRANSYNSAFYRNNGYQYLLAAT